MIEAKPDASPEHLKANFVPNFMTFRETQKLHESIEDAAKGSAEVRDANLLMVQMLSQRC